MVYASIEHVNIALDSAVAAGKNVVFVLRGLPGVGKTIMSQKISLQCAQRHLDCEVCSADQWFYFNGSYQFDRYGLPNAHKWSKGSFLLALDEAARVIIVDNTNIEARHAMFYVNHALNANYRVVLMEWECPSPAVADRVLARATRFADNHDAWHAMARNWEELDVDAGEEVFYNRFVPQFERDVNEEYRERLLQRVRSDYANHANCARCAESARERNPA